MSNSKLITSGLFAFTSTFLVYLILKKNKKTLNLLLKDNLTEKHIDKIFYEEFKEKPNKKDNYEQEKYEENNIEIKEENDDEENNIEIKERSEENDDEEIFNFQKVSNLDKKIKFIPDNNQKNENSWFSFLSFK